MSKEEISLELVKLALPGTIKQANLKQNYDIPQITIDLYNQIFSNIQVSEQNK